MYPGSHRASREGLGYQHETFLDPGIRKQPDLEREWWETEPANDVTASPRTSRFNSHTISYVISTLTTAYSYPVYCWIEEYMLLITRKKGLLRNLDPGVGLDYSSHRDLPNSNVRVVPGDSEPRLIPVDKLGLGPTITVKPMIQYRLVSSSFLCATQFPVGISRSNSTVRDTDLGHHNLSEFYNTSDKPVEGNRYYASGCDAFPVLSSLSHLRRLALAAGESHPSNCPCSNASRQDQEIDKYVLFGMKGQELQDYKQLDLRVCDGPWLLPGTYCFRLAHNLDPTAKKPS
ncbi:uncharacterized protein BO88DRAFT_419587 [Aspergillus vadensis CBS 113365]|uniref:Uncharacterized protein n=1 Tax=Aspergillus vadensis (strain CBS 113365 / IMI 142717 / IBT 24658) TaxID=1448311 RepID=A0A319BMA7_ASPVC|nr:hypothetical protein BO88DRAFT_419587 [Aspergillus vadensis CBS 113365]PYH64388.1 hypothetical protein BO88DRAFT_419587 [Aspergillus vadensis CBS 113365]